MTRLRQLSIVAVAAALSALAVPASSASGATSYTFNDLSGGPNTAKAHRIQDDLINPTIEAARKGDTIRLAIYVLDAPSTVKALEDAYHNGVHIEVLAERKQAPKPQHPVPPRSFENLWNLIDGKYNKHHSYAKDFTHPADYTQKASWVEMCATACTYAKGNINHQKFLLTSHGTNTVIQSSANMIDTSQEQAGSPPDSEDKGLSGNAAWNNAVTMTSPGVYHAYLAEFRAMTRGYRVHTAHTKGVTAPAHLHPGSSTSGDIETTFYPDPNKTVSPYIERLKSVTSADCKRGSSIRMVMGQFTDQTVAKRLHALAAHGCHVSVAYTLESGQSQAVEHDLITPCTTSSTPVSTHEFTKGAGQVHSKYVVIDLHEGHGKVTHTVLTGSLNATRTAYRNSDNSLIALTGATGRAAATVYRANFSDIVAAHGYTSSPVGTTCKH